MKRGLFAGTFDPPTIGHQDIIERASKLCDELYVGLATNSLKKPFYSLEKRKRMLEKIFSHVPKVKLVTIPAMVSDFAKANEISIFIRSLRPGYDLSSEFAMAAANKKMSGIETLFLLSDPSLAHISSTLAKEIIFVGGNPKEFVPHAIIEDLRN